MCKTAGRESRAGPEEPGGIARENAKPGRAFAEQETLIRTERIEAIRKKTAEGYYDRPEIIAAVIYDLTNPLLGRQHARETQLRWLMMDVEDTQKERCLARELAKC